MNQVSNRSEKSSTFFGGSNFMKLNNYKKYSFITFICFLFLVCLIFIYTNDKKELKLTKNMFLSNSPALKGKIKFIINKTVYMPYVEKKLLIKARHPLARYFNFYKIVTQNKKTYWVCPEMRISKLAHGKTKITYIDQTLPWRLCLLVLSILMLLAPCIVYPYLCKKRPDILTKFSSIKDWCNVLIIMGTCCFSLILLVIYSDSLITSASDDCGYFNTAIDMIKFDFRGPWSFTIGLGLWYIPFIIFLKASMFYDIALPFANFCGFIVMPTTMVLIYFIVKKITLSRTKALITVLLLALFPFFYHYMQDWNVHYFKSFCALPLSFNRFYNTILIRGYNCMSDTPSNFLIMLCFMLILYLPAKLKFVTLVSLIFAFACLVRINNIFFAPVTAWLFWIKFTEKTVNVKYLIQSATVAIATFTIAFLPQLIINHLQFDSFFTFPYILHNNEAAKGFKWATLNTGINFMGGANFAIWAAGLSGILLIKDRKLRNTLVLWGIPVILFFFGYPCIFTDARRFILSSFGAMLAAFVCVESWGEMSLKQKTASLIIIGAGLLFVTPSGYSYTGHLPFDLQCYRWGAKFITIMSILTPLATVILAWYLRHQKRAMLFVICFGVLYYAGSVYLLAVVMLLVLIWTLYDCSSEIWSKIHNSLRLNRKDLSMS